MFVKSVFIKGRAGYAATSVEPDSHLNVAVVGLIHPPTKRVSQDVQCFLPRLFIFFSSVLDRVKNKA